jgi:hypothetical protein
VYNSYGERLSSEVSTKESVTHGESSHMKSISDLSNGGFDFVAFPRASSGERNLRSHYGHGFENKYRIKFLSTDSYNRRIEVAVKMLAYKSLLVTYKILKLQPVSHLVGQLCASLTYRAPT